MHWSYVFPAPTHWNDDFHVIMSIPVVDFILDNFVMATLKCYILNIDGLKQNGT